ncbi:MAG: hypothetical protein PHC54_05080 [Candidatus Omnitrophica bacterium]|nr:hypothetical protein [Candidatus Omnitrophota bacterium]MDD5592725.1 hypothetical protein [Candidatus Omnitrophota bacterium]
MLKKGLALGFILVFFSLPCLAQGAPEDEGETFTITTYYPSPYGVYNQLQTNRFAVGDTNDSGGSLDANDQPPENGQLYVARSVIYKPQSELPESNAKEGELVYIDNNPADSTPGAFYYYGAGGWVTQGGGGAMVSLKCGWQRNCSACAAYVTQYHCTGESSCTPPECPTGWIPVTDFGGCITTFTHQHTTPNTADSGSNACTLTYTGGFCEQWCQKQ